VFKDEMTAATPFSEAVKQIRPISYATFRERLDVRLCETRFFLERMRRLEIDLQRCFDRDNLRRGEEYQAQYVYCFSAFLNSSRIAAYYMYRQVRGNKDARAWLESEQSGILHEVFRETRNFATHEMPVRYSITHPVKASISEEMRGVLPSNIPLDISPYLKSAGAPWMTLDLQDLPEAKRRIFAIFNQANPKRTSLTFICNELCDELDAIAARGFALGHL
jgi:hypothetical protein